ncbi:MAG: hypothetical protein H6740_23405 [Alphaproteobacteria bacterium]|nr:hypothetical protein [Alphaproteobacteria bacterium]
MTLFAACGVYIYRWDLDKTYLETDFDSFRGLLRSATEPAHEKRTVPGAKGLLRALSSHPAARVIILSGSPTQMREVLAEKLRLDGVRYEELHLKDNLGNLRRGRFRAVRGQFGYKLPMLLRGRVGLGAAVRECLFGDDAEVDALVYSVFADILAGRLRKVEVSRIMEAAGAYEDRIQEALDLMEHLPGVDVVDRIFIHLDRGVPTQRFDPLGQRVVPVHSWFQAALVLMDQGQLPPQGVAEVAREVMADAGLDARGLANLVQDLVRRGFAAPGVVAHLDARWPADEPLREALPFMQRAVDRIAELERRGPPPMGQVDYLRLLSSFGRKESQRDG